jgi:phosphoribosylformimino-5-aminoimidazole carboxamide ribotide isomerase
MRNFKIIPVIDILNSEAVHAVKGERASYKPLKSKLFQSSNPIEILKVLRHKYQFNEFYIADLDAITNRKPNFELLRKILKISGINILIDPGIANSKDIHQFFKYKIKKLILGLETIQSIRVVKKALDLMGQKNVIISIDMYKEKILTKAKGLYNKSSLEIIKGIELIGVKEVILLDLFRVGQKIGGIPQQYLDIQDSFNGDIYVGGGIKDYKDILTYKQQNFAGILIATALYDGTIDIEKLRKRCV